jgi:hypothetical protein
MELLVLYKTILESLNLHPNQDDMIFMDLGGEKDPITVNGKRLVLPTRAILREGLGDKLVAFHPISENFLTEGETPVFQELKKHIVLAVTVKAVVLIQRLMGLATDTKAHGKLSPKQHEFLSHVPHADGKTLALCAKLLSAIDITGAEKLINIYVRKGGQLQGKGYTRVGIVRFPMLDELDENKESIFGVKFARKKDITTIRALIEYVFPEAESGNPYSVGSTDEIAPGFDALMRAYLNVAKRINTVVKLFRDALIDGDTIKDWHDLLFDVSWEDAISDLSVYRGQIPNLDAAGNNPVVDTKKLEVVDESNTFNYKYEPPRQAQPTIAHPQAAQAGYVLPSINDNSGDGVDFEEIKARNAKVLTGQTAGGGYPYQAAPQQVYLQPGQIPPGYIQTPQGLVPAPMMDPRMMADPRMMGGQPEWMSAGVSGVAMAPMAMDPRFMGNMAMPANRMSTQERMQAGQRMDPRYYGGNTGYPMDPRMMNGGYPIDPRMMQGQPVMVNAAGIPVGQGPAYGQPAYNPGYIQPGYSGPTAVNMGANNPYGIPPLR